MSTLTTITHSIKGYLYQILNTKGIKYEEFTKVNNRVLIRRLNSVSITLLIVCFYYLYVDVVLLKDVKQLLYRYILIGLHSATFVISFFYLLIYKKIKDNNLFLDSKNTTLLINFYVFTFVSLGAFTSINSQLLTGNIDAYIIIVIAAAMIFPIKPIHLFFIFLINQTIFLIGLFLLIEDQLSFVTKQINSTTTVIISFFVSIAFYNFRKKDYVNQVHIREKENNFRKLFEVNPFPLILTKLSDGDVIKINNRALEFYNIQSDNKTNLNSKDFYKHKEERQTIVTELLQNGSVKNYIMEQKLTDGSLKWVMLNFELIEYEEENCILVGLTDITDLKKMEAELSKHASIDSLTGVLNRRSGIERLETTYDLANVTKRNFYLSFIDVNKLKHINDQFGHHEGDKLIKTVCTVIRDTIQQDDVLFRYGGDEFVIIFSDKDQSEVEHIWETILQKFIDVEMERQLLYSISVSYGIYRYEPENDITVEQILELADKEMYKQKNKLKLTI